uniref:DUF2380 domain-containing protein n=1 Tax=Hyalangium gracile TaxID=394092 RepID=UPI001CC9EE33
MAASPYQALEGGYYARPSSCPFTDKLLDQRHGAAHPGGTAQRYCGSADGLPKPSQPIIPWEPKPELLPSQKKLLEQWAAEWRRPHEKYHIFPQEPDLKA